MNLNTAPVSTTILPDLVIPLPHPLLYIIVRVRSLLSLRRGFALQCLSLSSSSDPLYSSLPEALEALIFSQNVFEFAGGVHAYQAIVCFLLQVITVDR